VESLWRNQVKNIKSKKSLSNKTHWEVIVVGAGLAGILTAYYLKEQGKDVLVLEAEEIASGQTERTTAKITSQHELKYGQLIETIGVEKTRLYARANEKAIKEYERLITEQGIECQFQRCPAFLYTNEDETELIEEAMIAASFGIDASFTKETELPFPVTGALCFKNQAQFSPLEFVKHLASDLEIKEHTLVTAIKGNCVITKEKTFTADKIVVATHYPIKNIPGFYFLRQHQERSYVLALSGCPKIEGMYRGIDSDGLSFRQAGDVLLFGGGGHRSGENTCGGVYETLLRKAKEYYPNCQEILRWSAQDCMPHDGIPFIGKYSIFTPNLYVATGFGKWGMTSSMIAAMILRDEICGFENKYAQVFTPQRLYAKAGWKNFRKDVGISIKGLFNGLIIGKAPRCSHMGCELHYNPDEKTWECSCHGSRYDENGKLLDNPSKKSYRKE